MVPKFVFFTKGIGFHEDQLQSFEFSLRSAGIEKCNIVRVSSILPPGCIVISREKGLAKLKPGMITYTVMSTCSSNERRRLIAASIGCAIPTDRQMYGYLSEHHAYGQTEKTAGDYSEDLAATMLASTLGVQDFDEDKSWDEKKEVFRISGKIIKTTNITQSTIIKQATGYTTVLAAAVLLIS